MKGKNIGHETAEPEEPATRETSMASIPIAEASSTSLITVHSEDSLIENTTHNYELAERISDGGQATVFKAKARDSNEWVALKIFKTSEEDPQSLQRFRREAQILSGLAHPNIVAYKGVFTAEGEWGEARQCLVMEFLEGLSLKQYIQQHPQGCPWAEASAIFRQSLSALIYAHDERGIIHRDIKPSNIHLLPNGQVKVIDFGIARLNDGGTHTGGSGFLGSFDYMAPDFARVKETDFRGDAVSDIFSLFVCFYEMITGRLPHAKLGERQELDYLRRWHGEVTPPSMDHAIFRVITHLSKFMQKGLAPDRTQRYQKLAEVLKEFDALKPRSIVRDNKERYTLTDALGAGGFSEVYKAQRESDGATVAIKRLFANRSLDRFIKEAEMLSLHPHPNVVRYHDFFETQSASGRTDSFLVMEYLDGMPGWSLRERIREHPDGLPVDEMVETFGYYLATLAYLNRHEYRVVHRDIKPANLYAPEGQPAKAKLIDFGCARDVSGTKTTGNLPGTWDYMAPEFVTEGSRGTPQSDLYALGLSFYEALTGRPAYPRLPKSEREALTEFLARAKGQSSLQIDFSSVVFERHPRLAEVIRRATARKTRERYSDALQMWKDLDTTLQEGFGRSLPPVEDLIPPAPPQGPGGADVTRALNPFHAAHAKHRRRSVARMARAALVLALLGAMGGAGWAYRAKLEAPLTALLGKALRVLRPAPAQSAPPAVDTASSAKAPPAMATENPPPAVTAASPPIVAEVLPAKETPPPVVAPEKIAEPPPPAVPPEEARQRTLLRDLQLSLEPLTYFVAAGSKYDALRAEIAKSSTMLNKTLSAAKYASVASSPSVRATQATIWRGILNEVMTLLQEQKDLSLLPLVRGSLYALFNLQTEEARKGSFQARVESLLAAIQKQYPGLHTDRYLPFPQSEAFRIAMGADGQWLATPFLNEVFARPEAQNVRARLLPHRATLQVSARNATGQATRSLALSFALVPDGDSGTGLAPNAFYMATVETPLEAIRCYRDDAARWASTHKPLFSGHVAGRTLGPNEYPYFQARPEEAMEFCNWASTLAGLPPVYRKTAEGQWLADLRQPGFRLPTRTEWEYAARYGFDFYRKPGEATWDERRKTLQTSPLVHYYFKRELRFGAASTPYPLGLHDLSGNVEEICMVEDLPAAGPADPREPQFVLKGGSAKSRMDSEVIPSYEAKTIDSTHEFVGFRMVLPASIEQFQ